MLGSYNLKFTLLCSLILSLCLVTREGLSQEVISIKNRHEKASEPKINQSRKKKWSVAYHFGPKIGISHFTLTSRIATNQSTSGGAVVTGFANVFGLTQALSILASRRIDLTLELSLLSARYSHPSDQNASTNKGLLGNGYQAQLGIHSYVTGEEAYFITQLGTIHHQIIQKNEAQSTDLITISPNPLAFVAIGLGSKLKKHFLVKATLAQYVDHLPGASLTEVSLHYLF